MTKGDIMKKIIILTSLLAFFSCEDNKDDDSSLIGTWELSNLGEYANADCTGDLDASGWALIQAFGMTVTMTMEADGKGTYSVKYGTDIESVPLTWNEKEICIYGECSSYKLSGDSFDMTQLEEAYCEDDYGDETSHSTKDACESSSSREWIEASCSKMTFTKE